RPSMRGRESPSPCRPLSSVVRRDDGGAAMWGKLWDRWLRGLSLSIYANLFLAIAWGVPAGIPYIVTGKTWTETPRPALGLQFAALLLLCPLAFEWLARKAGLTTENRG